MTCDHVETGLDEEDTAGMLFTPSDDMEWLIEGERKRATAIVTANLRSLAGRTGTFKLVEHTLEVYGEAYGVATEPTVTAAIQALKTAGDLVVYQNAPRLRDRIVGGPKA